MPLLHWTIQTRRAVSDGERTCTLRPRTESLSSLCSAFMSFESRSASVLHPSMSHAWSTLTVVAEQYVAD